MRDPLAVLLQIDRRLLEAFSQRTTDRLRTVVGLGMLLPHIESFLAKNVGKEVVKDAIVIRYAATKSTDAAPSDPHAVQYLLGKVKEVDREFLRSVDGFPFRITIPYDQVTPLRTQRIQCTLDLSHRVLQAWRKGHRLRRTFTKAELERRLLEIFTLYVKETIAHNQSVQLPMIFAPLRTWLSQELQRIMQEVVTQLVNEICTGVYRR